MYRETHKSSVYSLMKSHKVNKLKNHHIDQEIRYHARNRAAPKKSPPSPPVFSPRLYRTIFSPGVCYYKRIQNIVITLMELTIREEDRKFDSEHEFSQDF